VPVNLGPVTRVCEVCRATVLTHSGNFRWCPKCRVIEYPKSLKAARKRFARRAKRRRGC
jgi:Zn finger protein HypA/HybF involved in hydrogenase expression